MYNVYVDTSKIESVVKELDDAASNLEEYFADIYDKLDKLNESWSGPAYDTFRRKCDDFRPAMNALVTVLKAYSLLLSSNVTDAATTLNDDVVKAFAEVLG